jgi:hypothetical protein
MSREQPATRFIVTLEAPADTDATRTLRAALKVLWRRFRLKCVSVHEESIPPFQRSRQAQSSICEHDR